MKMGTQFLIPELTISSKNCELNRRAWQGLCRPCPLFTTVIVARRGAGGWDRKGIYRERVSYEMLLKSGTDVSG
jgi:hypothetical protein